jgi:hypothetical protein
MADLVLDQITEGKPVLIEKNGKSICVARVGDEVFAVDDTCTKRTSPSLDGCTILIVRARRGGVGLARPCRSCMWLLGREGISDIRWTQNDGSIVRVTHR